MKIRLTQPGWENYTGQMGIVLFENGVSVEDVPRVQAMRISASMFCESEDGESLSITQDIITANHNEAPVMPDNLGVDTSVEPEVPAPAENPVVPPVSETEQVDGPKVYTVAALEAIADEHGIAGLRVIADPLGIKSRSVQGLLDELIAAGVAKRPE